MMDEVFGAGVIVLFFVILYKILIISIHVTNMYRFET